MIKVETTSANLCDEVHRLNRDGYTVVGSNLKTGDILILSAKKIRLSADDIVKPPISSGKISLSKKYSISMLELPKRRSTRGNK